MCSWKPELPLRTPVMLRISRSIKQTQSFIKSQTYRPLSISSSEPLDCIAFHTYQLTTSAGMSDKSSFDAIKGSVGKEFTPEGKIGGTAQDKLGMGLQMAGHFQQLQCHNVFKEPANIAF